MIVKIQDTESEKRKAIFSCIMKNYIKNQMN